MITLRGWIAAFLLSAAAAAYLAGVTPAQVAASAIFGGAKAYNTFVAAPPVEAAQVAPLPADPSFEQFRKEALEQFRKEALAH